VKNGRALQRFTASTVPCCAQLRTLRQASESEREKFDFFSDLLSKRGFPFVVVADNLLAGVSVSALLFALVCVPAAVVAYRPVLMMHGLSFSPFAGTHHVRTRERRQTERERKKSKKNRKKLFFFFFSLCALSSLFFFKGL
jgi:hypothetical protein